MAPIAPISSSWPAEILGLPLSLTRYWLQSEIRGAHFFLSFFVRPNVQDFKSGTTIVLYGTYNL
jgi:hypothetical protein